MSIAEKMAANQKQVAISEFFEKNKHFLGFDTLTRALITAVKEAVDNALDACEEARILPDIIVQITKIDNKKDILQLDVKITALVFLVQASRKCLDNSSLVHGFTQFASHAANKVSELLA